MKPIGDLLKPLGIFEKKRITERGELLTYFSMKTGKPIGYIAMRLTGIPTADLYFIQKQCDQYKGPWTKAFYGMLKVGDNPVDSKR